MSETRLTFASPIRASADILYDWHSHDGAFDRLSPPWANVTVLESRGTMQSGDGKRLRLGIGPIGIPWSIVHESPETGLGFVDIQQSGPFASWKHDHRFLADSTMASILQDQLTYTLPLGAAGKIVAGRPVQHKLEELFHYRHRRTQGDLMRHSRFQFDSPLRVAVTGATGLVGKVLVSFLRAGGHEVIPISRKAGSAPNEIMWNPAKGEIDATKLEGLDAIIHLAGVSIAGGRWSASRKEQILKSRVDGTSLLSKTLAGLTSKPKVLVSTSAVGYYGDAPGVLLTEDSPAGNEFLSDVCVQWEAATASASDAGIRVVNPRFGVVFSGDGGMLPLISKAFLLGGGGPLGSGKQSMSWIAIDDLLGVLLESIGNENLSGPVNAVAPKAVTNAEFTKTLAHVLRRPAFFRVPAFALRLVAGELADELLLVDQAVDPKKLREAGFEFQFGSLEETFRHELGRARGTGDVTVSVGINSDSQGKLK